MNIAAKIIYWAQAVWFTGAGVFYLYAAGSVGDGARHWFGVDAFHWVGLVFLLVALGWWFLLLVRPDLLAGE